MTKKRVDDHDLRYVTAERLVNLASARDVEACAKAVRRLVSHFSDLEMPVVRGREDVRGALAAHKLARRVVDGARRWEKVGKTERRRLMALVNERLPKGRRARVDYALTERGLVKVDDIKLLSLVEAAAVASAQVIELAQAGRAPPRPLARFLTCGECGAVFSQPWTRGAPAVACPEHRRDRHRRQMRELARRNRRAAGVEARHKKRAQ